MKNVLVFGAGGFIGGHLCKKLVKDGYYVVGVDIKLNEYWDYGSSRITDTEYGRLEGHFDRFYLMDLRDPKNVEYLINMFRPYRLYQLAADMGGAGYIFSGEHDADVMHNSACINLNTLDSLTKYSRDTRVFYSSSACIYPEHNQLDPDNPNCEESSAYPANPDSEYGWEKLFSERMYHAYMRNYGLDVRIARFHNVFGPEGSWNNGKEKSPAAICRKVAMTSDESNVVEIWGTGKQTRSFLFIDECLEGVERLMQSDCTEVVNIGSDEMISINDLAYMVADIAGKQIELKHIDGPLGVMGRKSQNDFIESMIGWRPTRKLRDGMEVTYKWISEMINE